MIVSCEKCIAFEVEILVARKLSQKMTEKKGGKSILSLNNCNITKETGRQEKKSILSLNNCKNDRKNRGKGHLVAQQLPGR